MQFSVFKYIIKLKFKGIKRGHHMKKEPLLEKIGDAGLKRGVMSLNIT